MTAPIPENFPGGDTSFFNNLPDPVTTAAELPRFKFELKASEDKQDGGSFGKQVTVDELPLAKGMAGVSMQLQPGVMREMHWHAMAAEWAYVLEGRVRTTVVDPAGHSETNDFDPGDADYIPQGFGHSLENVSGEVARIVIGLNSGTYQTMDLSQWIAGQPDDVLETNLGKSADQLEGLPRADLFINEGGEPTST